MRIDPKFRLHQVAGQQILILLGGAKNHVMDFNDTSVFLWENLKEREFELEDVVRLLTKGYDVERSQARRDATQWVLQLQKYGIIIL